ncbi:EcsC family protein [Paenibacillus sp. MMS20-IR301]|uniref:EcsC family protein n=1 Tax=Paenibacillus sp. MMS20-IR301 TaxID=2895946 RepID=UPI0028EF2C13|nr:EcsC family protein [Paenibacillus sp. MMS20-IR301]WNS42414.1 EcsC family protein [Paenibacillus sp. MMS20-IR301]
MPDTADSRALLETPEALRAALAEIAKWEKEQNKLMIWDRITRLPFKLLDKLTPKFIHEKVGKLLDELGSYIQNGGNYLVAGRKVGTMMEEASRAAGGTGSGPYPLAVMDAAALRLAGRSRNTATAQGATTGFGGVFTLAIDIPAVLGLSLKAIQEIALCYGYDPTEKAERIFTVKVMQFASSDIVGKRTILRELNLQAGGDGNISAGTNAAISKIQGWREVVMVYRDNWGWKKLLQMVPVAGMFFGAYLNRKSLEDVTEAAHMLYRKRRIIARLAELEQI